MAAQERMLSDCYVVCVTTQRQSAIRLATTRGAGKTFVKVSVSPVRQHSKNLPHLHRLSELSCALRNHCLEAA